MTNHSLFNKLLVRFAFVALFGLILAALPTVSSINQGDGNTAWAMRGSKKGKARKSRTNRNTQTGSQRSFWGGLVDRFRPGRTRAQLEADLADPKLKKQIRSLTKHGLINSDDEVRHISPNHDPVYGAGKKRSGHKKGGYEESLDEESNGDESSSSSGEEDDPNSPRGEFFKKTKPGDAYWQRDKTKLGHALNVLYYVGSGSRIGKLSVPKIALQVSLTGIFLGVAGTTLSLTRPWEKSSSPSSKNVIAPDVQTNSVTSLTANSAALSGQINPEAQVGVTYRFEYKENTPGAQSDFVPSEPQAVAQSSNYLNVTNTAQGLKSGTEYAFRLVGYDPNGKPYPGVWQTFTTFPAPQLTIAQPTAVTLTSALLAGTVDAEGQNGLTYQFSYKQTGDSTWLTTPQQSVPAGSGPQPVSAAITGLTAGSNYQATLEVYAGTDLQSQTSPITFTTPVVGSLTQPTGTAGCIEQSGGEGCATSRTLTNQVSKLTAPIAVSPDGNNVYVADPNGVTILTRDSQTGALSQPEGTAGCINESGANGCQTGQATLNNIQALAISSDGKTIYAAGFIGVSILVRDPSTGALTQPSGQAGCISPLVQYGCAVGRTVGALNSIAISPTSDTVYTANLAGAISVLVRNQQTGALSEASDITGCISPGGNNSCTVGRNVLSDSVALAVSGDGANVYVTSNGDGNNAVSVLMRNSQTGVLSQATDTTGCITSEGSNGCANGRNTLNDLTGVAISGDGNNVYTASEQDGSVSVLSRTAANGGALSQATGTAGCISPAGINGCATGSAALSSPTALALSGDGADLYVSSSQSQAVSILSRAQDGSLSQAPQTAGCISEAGVNNCASGRALGGPIGLALSSDGTDVYAFSSQAVAVLSRELGTVSAMPILGMLGR